LDWLPGISSGPPFGPTHPAPPPSPRPRTGSGKEMPNGSGSGSQASAEPVEAMFAEVAAQRHHADAAKQDVEQSAMRPPDVGFMALWTSNSHSWQSPENLRPGEVGLPRRLPLHSELQGAPLLTDTKQPEQCITMMHSPRSNRNQIFTRAAATSLTLTRQKTMRCITGANHALRLLRNRKKRCAQRLQRKGTMPTMRNRISNSRRCDLRILHSRHFGHDIAIASNLLKEL